MAYDNNRITDRELRDAMRDIVAHANATRAIDGRLSKEDLMKRIDVLAKAEADYDWTVYYP